MIEYIEIKGYKSIKELKLKLRPINLLIGSNGVGKTNFISFFKLLEAILNYRLQKYVAVENADNILYFGRRQTRSMFGRLILINNNTDNFSYYFYLSARTDGGLFIEHEASGNNVKVDSENYNYDILHILDESEIFQNYHGRDIKLIESISEIKIFHFQDTSSTSYLRKGCDIDDNLYLRQDGRNLPAILYLLKNKQPLNYKIIFKTIQSVAPFIDKLILEPKKLNEKEIELRWVDKGDSESNFSVNQLSDGTLRFIALATLLLQPEPPEVIIIDEPELGLHPFAIGKLAGMIQSASSKSQVIAATQSPSLISHFSPEDIIVIDKNDKENQTIVNRLSTDALKNWLEDYTLGDLWERNIINAAQPFKKI